MKKKTDKEKPLFTDQLPPLTIDSVPHLRNNSSVRSMMRDVLLAQCPLLLFAVWHFGFRALTVVVLSVLLCLACEGIYTAVRREKLSLFDGSAAVTGMTLGLLMPVHVPFWLLAVCAVLAILPGKLLWGGLGKNFVNPALLGRFLPALFLPSLLSPVKLAEKAGLFSSSSTLLKAAVSGETAVETLKEGRLPTDLSITDMLFGQQVGLLGTVCGALILLGGCYLLLRRVISWQIPVSLLGTVATLTFLFPYDGNGLMQRLLMNERLDFMLGQLFAGGLLFVAFFVATDPVTTPLTTEGKLTYGALCGLITVGIRFFSPVPEGVYVAVLAANLLSRPLDCLFRPARFGSKTRYKPADTENATEHPR